MPRPKAPATFETRLSSVKWHHLAVECSCGHTALVPVEPALERLGPDAMVRDMLALVRCSSCRARRVVGARLVYVGGSAAAMASAPDTDVHLPKRQR